MRDSLTGQSGVRFTAFWTIGVPGRHTDMILQSTTTKSLSSHMVCASLRCAKCEACDWSRKHRWALIGRTNDTDGLGAWEATIPVLWSLILSWPLDTEFKMSLLLLFTLGLPTKTSSSTVSPTDEQLGNPSVQVMRNNSIKTLCAANNFPP